jgi:hypothetical protein
MSDDFRSRPPPRKASVFKEHPFFNSYCKHIGLKFNGRVLTKSAFTYDADEGWVEVAILTKRGKFKAERGVPVALRIPGTVEPYWR